MRQNITIGIGIAAALLSACKGDGGSGTPFCRAIGGGAAVATEVCGSNCNQENIAAAVDADFRTAATIRVSVQNQGALRGTAQDGVVFTADGPAGVYVHKPPLVNGGTFDIAVTTYLDGAPQESALAYSESGATGGGTFCNACALDGANMFLGIPTTLPFDAIEIGYTQSAGTRSREIQVFEFCQL